MCNFPFWERGRLFVIREVTHGPRVIIFGSARQRSHDLPETKWNWINFFLLFLPIYDGKINCQHARVVSPIPSQCLCALSFCQKGQRKLPSPGQVNRKWIQVVLGHARWNRNVTQVPLHHHSLVVVSSWRSGQRDIFVLHTSTGQRYLDFQTKIPSSFLSYKGESLFGLFRTSVSCAPADARRWISPTNKRGRKILRWQRACCRFTSKNTRWVRHQEAAEEGIRN